MRSKLNMAATSTNTVARQSTYCHKQSAGRHCQLNQLITLKEARLPDHAHYCTIDFIILWNRKNELYLQ